MTIEKALKWAVLKLTKGKIQSPHQDSEIILSSIINKTREYIIAHGEVKLSKKEIEKFEYLVTRRSKNEPLAYLTGNKQFYGLDFYVNKHTLIPRPETELMVELVLNLIKQNKKNTIIFDMGTGSGCIIISIVKELLNCKLKIKNYKFIASDISGKTLLTAKKNAKVHKVDKMIKFYKGDLLEPIIKDNLIIKNSNLIVLANLPYLTPLQYKNAPTIRYEPKTALIAGSDGLKYYKKLFEQIKKNIDINKNSLHVLCEIDFSQVNKIKKLALNLFPELNFKIKKDLRGLNRLVLLSN